MSKLYNIYQDLKKEDKEKIYIFKAGAFFILLDDDAKLISEKLNLKLTKLNDSLVKCGFPINSIEKYTKKIKELKISYKIIDGTKSVVKSNDAYIENIKFQTVINKIKDLNINKTSPLQALNILSEFKNIICNSNDIS